MRLGFSTLGCSGEPLGDVVALATSTGWRGVELRAAADEPVHTGLPARQRAAVRRVLHDGGVTPIAIASYVRVADPDADDESVLADVLAHVELAHDVGAGSVRVFPGGDPRRGRRSDDAAVARLGAAAEAIGDRPVTLALETHDSHGRGSDVARVLDRVGDGRVRAIWDALHPWLNGESAVDTAAALGEHLAHVQVKDVASASDLTPVLPGSGVLPLRDVAELARQIRPDGWVSLEWESKWFPAAAPLRDALDATSDLVRTWAGYPSPERPNR